MEKLVCMLKVTGKNYLTNKPGFNIEIRSNVDNGLANIFNCGDSVIILKPILLIPFLEKLINHYN